MSKELIDTVSEELMKQILEKLDVVSTKVEAMDGKIEAMDSKIEVMNGKIEAMDSKIEVMDSKIDRIESKLEATFEQVAKSAEVINEIASTQERHERILGILSMRSIEQESYIRRP